MTKKPMRLTVFAFLIAGLAALPAMAQPIPAGNDYWRTPGDGQTFFEFPDGDVEALCDLPPVAGWNHQAALKGVPQAGSDWDTVVHRLDSVSFPPFNGTPQSMTTRIQVQFLHFVSVAPQPTPCGDLSWTARLAGTQPITDMDITRTSPRGGFFTAHLTVSVELAATDSAGNYVGSLFYTRELPDSTASGTPWSWGPDTNPIFRAGMTDKDDCIAVLREKLNTIDPKSSHFYWVSDMIAKGQCKRPN
jgi:hypothetical protein